MDQATEMEASARATLSVCESLVIALTESGTLDREEMLETLMDARHAHSQLAAELEEMDHEELTRRQVHLRAAEIIARLIDGVRATAPLP